MTSKDRFQRPMKFARIVARWCILSVIMGTVGGLLGTVFHHALHFVTHVRSEHMWLIFFLPLGGLLTAAIYRHPKMKGNKGTNEIIEATLDGHPVGSMVAPSIFLATAITHLFGGSAGREGAALQLGGSAASMLARLFHLKESNRKILITAGMSAVFAGLFGTPLTATLFCIEFASVGTMLSPALLPCFLSAFTASRISLALGVHPETHMITQVFSMTLNTSWRYMILAVLVSLLGILMCTVFHKAEHLASHHLPNPFLRIVIGGAVVTAMTLLVGDHRFNGAGMEMALNAVSGESDWYSFALKMLFTAVTLAAGFKGGEIVPTFCIGATFGCVLGGLLGLDAGMAAALGLIGLFCCATNSPFASIMLSVEMFGGTNIHLFAFVCVICFVLSGNYGLYASQILQYNKADMLGEF